MDQFTNMILVLMAVLLSFSSTDGAIDSWDLDSSGSATSAVDASFTKTLAEDATTIFEVTATTDATSVDTYAIVTQTNSGQFEIATSSSGAVTLVSGQTLDYESDTTLTVEVSATDDGSNVGTATVVITVTDVNDNTPAFSAPSTTTKYVAANDASAASTAIYTVTATDADGTGNTITYSIASGNTNTDFAIGSSTGKITVAKTLDMSTTSTYGLVIEAADSASSPDTGTVTVSVVVWDYSCSGAGSVGVSSLTLLVLLLFYVF